MAGLTETQRDILDFIEETMDRLDQGPTVQEIAERFALSESTVLACLKAIQRRREQQRRGWLRGSQAYRTPEACQMSFALPVRLLGRINAGLPADSPELEEGTLYVSSELVPESDPEQLFALQITGQSMRDLGLYEGDYVIVDRNAAIRSGDVVVALVNNETTVKSFYPCPDSRVELRPANPDFAPQFYNASQVQLQGRVVLLQRRFR